MDKFFLLLKKFFILIVIDINAEISVYSLPSNFWISIDDYLFYCYVFDSDHNKYYHNYNDF